MRSKSIVHLLLLIVGVGCSSTPPSPLPTDVLPRVGDTKAQVDRLMSGRRADGDTDAYELHLVNQFVRVSLMYSRYADGTIRVMQVNLQNKQGISDEALQEAKRQLIPSDARVLKQRDVGAVVFDDAQGMAPGEDMAFLRSATLARRIVSRRYYHRAWYMGQCPRAAPGILEEYTSRNHDMLERIGFFAAYLDKCQEKLLYIDGKLS